jgi:hypothetical protein
MSTLLTVSTHEGQECLNMFQTLSLNFTGCFYMILKFLILGRRQFDQSIIYLVYSGNEREESSGDCCCL